MTLYTDSLYNLNIYKTDYYRIAVSSSLAHGLQSKVDAWFHELSPSKNLSDRFENGQINYQEFSDLYIKEMGNSASKSKISWINHYSKKNDVVILCFEKESDQKCHRHILKKIIDNTKII